MVSFFCPVERLVYPTRQKSSEMNVFAMRLGPGKHLQGRTLLGGVIETEDYDHFHEVRELHQPERARFLNTVQLILNLELARCGCRGYVDGFLAGGVIGLPPVLNFGSDEIKAQVVPEVLAGKKFICLAISEAFAGSDVGGLQTTAVRDSDHWVISGTKKYASCCDPAATHGSETDPGFRWITNGMFADYFTVACRTEVSALLLFTSSHTEYDSGRIHRYPRPKGRESRDESDQDNVLTYRRNRVRYL